MGNGFTPPPPTNITGPATVGDVLTATANATGEPYTAEWAAGGGGGGQVFHLTAGGIALPPVTGIQVGPTQIIGQMIGNGWFLFNVTGTAVNDYVSLTVDDVLHTLTIAGFDSSGTASIIELAALQTTRDIASGGGVNLGVNAPVSRTAGGPSVFQAPAGTVPPAVPANAVAGDILFSCSALVPGAISVPNMWVVNDDVATVTPILDNSRISGTGDTGTYQLDEHYFNLAAGGGVASWVDSTYYLVLSNFSTTTPMLFSYNKPFQNGYVTQLSAGMPAITFSMTQVTLPSGGGPYTGVAIIQGV